MFSQNFSVFSYIIQDVLYKPLNRYSLLLIFFIENAPHMLHFGAKWISLEFLSEKFWIFKKFSNFYKEISDFWIFARAMIISGETLHTRLTLIALFWHERSTIKVKHPVFSNKIDRNTVKWVWKGHLMFHVMFLSLRIIARGQFL